MDPANGDRPHSFVGQSQPVRNIRQLIEKLGRSRSTVLLLGESGVGKEVVASAIHHGNPTGNFVPICCASLVGPLMESELFGHTKGAFTGAAEAKRGLIELANGGTAFFDEIGDLPLDMQMKLLRVLQEREVRPIGSLVWHKVELRVIAATHHDLAKDVASGNFRQDLFYRLNVVKVRIPPLRDRKEDIPLLVEHFLSGMGRPYSVTREAMDAMLAYDWPGNVRELSNCLHRMVAMNSGPLLHTEDLSSSVTNCLLASRAESLSMAATIAPGASFTRSQPDFLPNKDAGPILPLIEVEKRAILNALDYADGDCTKAAQLLGIGRTTLYRKMKEYTGRGSLDPAKN